MSNYITKRTITGRDLSIRSNKQARTFTIKTDSGSKYRTTKFSKEDFEHADRHWTGNDWQNFLKTTNEYYKI